MRPATCSTANAKSSWLRRLALLGLAVTVLAFAAPLRSAEAKYASIVIDAATGTVLHETNADTRNYPASLTKMMTLYLVFEALERGEITFNTKLKVSSKAAKQQPSKLNLKTGATISVEDAILALVTKSANDVAMVVAEGLGKSEAGFAKLMNAKAKALGMTRTIFYNPHGLPDKRQLSTARDMATLSVALMRDFPQYYHFFATNNFTYKGKRYDNHNKLLASYSGVDGIKTGYTRASGFNISVSAVRDGRRLIAVVFGGKTSAARNSHASDLLDQAFVDASKLPLKAPPVVVTADYNPPAPPEKPSVLVDLASFAQGDAADDPVAALIRAEETQVAALPNVATDASPSGAIVPPLVPQPAAAAPVPPQSLPLGSWAIQVGAFSQENSAWEAATSAGLYAPPQLDQARLWVMEVEGQNGRLYRARLGDLTEANAREACRLLTKQNVACLVVAPGT